MTEDLSIVTRVEIATQRTIPVPEWEGLRADLCKEGHPTIRDIAFGIAFTVFGLMIDAAYETVNDPQSAPSMIWVIVCALVFLVAFSVWFVLRNSHDQALSHSRATFMRWDKYYLPTKPGSGAPTTSSPASDTITTDPESIV